VPYPQLIRFPEPVSGDVQGRHRDWLEVYGETKPIMNWETVKAPANGGLYEYCSAFGYSKASFTDPLPETGSRRRGRKRKRSAPVIGVAGKAAADAAGLPELGSVAEAVGRLKLTSVPQADGAKWFVRRIDRVWSKSLFHGIEWELSLGLLLQLGTRVTGGLLASFASAGGDSGNCDHSRGLLAQAVMHYDADGSQDVWLPPENEPLELALKPVPPI
jgi:hypothetical protein